MDQESSNKEKKKATTLTNNGLLDELESDSNEDADALLAKAIPNLDKELNQLQSDFLGLNADIESLDIGENQNQAPSSSLIKRLSRLQKKIQKIMVHFYEKVFIRLKYLIIWIILELPKKISSLWKAFSAKATSLFQKFSTWSKKRKILFFSFFIFFTSIFYLYYKILKDDLSIFNDYQFYGSMKELSDVSFSYDLQEEVEPFYNSPRVKVYTFKMKPIVVNLKRVKGSDDNPMSYFEFVFVGNSNDVVVEFKNRESEMIDLVQRTIEKMTYNTLDSVNGKELLKQRLQKEINKKLSDGVIKKVELHNFFLKP